MSDFRKYMHVERFGNDEVQGIELGECHVFPKLDGTNGSVWIGDDGELCAGSRNRHLTLDSDNAGFLEHVLENESIANYMKSYPHHTLYGEWLVPHSLKTYRDDAWRTFYVFDVYCNGSEKYLSYYDYAASLDYHGIDYIPPMTVIKNATYDNLLKELEKNVFLVSDGKGAGEGIVIKNYQYQNGFGRTVWAKMVTTAFKEKHVKEMGPSIINGTKMVEQEIVDTYITKHLVDKVYAKIATEQSGWNSKYIPRLLNTVFYDLVNEDCWSFVKKLKNPTVNFKTLHSLTVLEIKALRPELF